MSAYSHSLPADLLFPTCTSWVWGCGEDWCSRADHHSPKTWELFPYSGTTTADLLWKEVCVCTHAWGGAGYARGEVKIFGNELKSSLPSSSYSEALPQSSTVSPACSSHTKHHSHLLMPEALPTVEHQGLPRKQEKSVQTQSSSCSFAWNLIWCGGRPEGFHGDRMEAFQCCWNTHSSLILCLRWAN